MMGVLWFYESPARHFFQLTGKWFHLEDSGWQGPRSNQVVHIGRNLDLAELEHKLKACLSDET